MDVWAAVKSCFRQYVGFSGRAPRSEYWLWVLFCAVVGGVLHGIEPGGADGSPGPLSGAWNLGTLLPSLAVAVRRLHDTERSGWWLLLPFGAMAVCGFWVAMMVVASGGGSSEQALAALGPELVGLLLAVAVMLGIMVLMVVWMASRGTAGTNRFGTDPLAAGG